MSHAGTVLLAELVDRIGLTAALSEVTDGLRERRGGHDPGPVLVDVAVAIADGAVTISDVQTLADQQGLTDRPAARRPRRPAAMTALEVRHADGVEGHLAGPGATVVRPGQRQPWQVVAVTADTLRLRTWPGTSWRSPGAACDPTRWTRPSVGA